MDRLPIGQAIPAIQARLRLTPEAMAAELGTTRPTLSRWQRGKARPQYDVIPRLLDMGRRAGIEIIIESVMRDPGKKRK